MRERNLLALVQQYNVTPHTHRDVVQYLGLVQQHVSKKTFESLDVVDNDARPTSATPAEHHLAHVEETCPSASSVENPALLSMRPPSGKNSDLKTHYLHQPEDDPCAATVRFRQQEDFTDYVLPAQYEYDPGYAYFTDVPPEFYDMYDSEQPPYVDNEVTVFTTTDSDQGPYTSKAVTVSTDSASSQVPLKDNEVTLYTTLGSGPITKALPFSVSNHDQTCCVTNSQKGGFSFF